MQGCGHKRAQSLLYCKLTPRGWLLLCYLPLTWHGKEECKVWKERGFSSQPSSKWYSIWETCLLLSQYEPNVCCKAEATVTPQHKGMIYISLEGASQVIQLVKNLPANAGDSRDGGLILGLGKSPGVGNGNPCQYSCLENPINRGAWWATVHGVARAEHDWMKGVCYDCLIMRSLALGPACLGLGVSVTGARTLAVMFSNSILRLQLLKTQKVYSCLQNANRKLDPSPLFLFPSTFTHTHTHTHTHTRMHSQR